MANLEINVRSGVRTHRPVWIRVGGLQRIHAVPATDVKPEAWELVGGGTGVGPALLRVLVVVVEISRHRMIDRLLVWNRRD